MSRLAKHEGDEEVNDDLWAELAPPAPEWRRWRVPELFRQHMRESNRPTHSNNSRRAERMRRRHQR